MKICILGNSVAIKMRPPRSGADELTYPERLQASGHDVHNASMAGVFLSEQFAFLDDDVLTCNADAVILHHGIIEVYFRRTMRAPNNAAILNQYRNRVLGQGYTYDTATSRLRRFPVRALNAATRRLAQLLGLRWQWQRPDDFMTVVTQVVGLILKETAARMIIVGITPPSAGTEADLPGLGEEIARLNERLRAEAVRYGSRVQFVDVTALLRDGDHSRLVPDGIHFSATAHRLLAGELLAVLEDSRAE